MDNPRVVLSKTEFDKYTVEFPSNLVIVQMDKEEELKTSAGISIGFNPNVQYGSHDGTDTSSHIADVCAVTGIVVKTVNKIYFNLKDLKNTNSWDTDMEIKVGDMVWSHPLAMKNCPEILVDNVLYKALRYEDLFCCKRVSQIICLNGNVILEEVYLPTLSSLDVLEKDVDTERGIVRFNGIDNRLYQTPGIADMPNLKDGDLVVIQKGSYPSYLERFNYNTKFDNGKMYLVTQKRYITCVISEGN